MKIAIIGSTEYAESMDNYIVEQSEKYPKNIYCLPEFDSTIMLPLAVCQQNIKNIKWADKVVVFWNARSMGTWGDFMAALALDKPIEIIHITPYEQSFPKAMQEYHDECNK